MPGPDIATLQANLDALKTQAAQQFQQLLQSGQAPSPTAEGFRQWVQSGAPRALPPETWTANPNYANPNWGAYQQYLQQGTRYGAQSVADAFNSSRAALDSMVDKLAAAKDALAGTVQQGVTAVEATGAQAIEFVEEHPVESGMAAQATNTAIRAAGTQLMGGGTAAAGGLAGEAAGGAALAEAGAGAATLAEAGAGAATLAEAGAGAGALAEAGAGLSLLGPVGLAVGAAVLLGVGAWWLAHRPPSNSSTAQAGAAATPGPNPSFRPSGGQGASVPVPWAGTYAVGNMTSSGGPCTDRLGRLSFTGSANSANVSVEWIENGGTYTDHLTGTVNNSIALHADGTRDIGGGLSLTITGTFVENGGEVTLTNGLIDTQSDSRCQYNFTARKVG